MRRRASSRPSLCGSSTSIGRSIAATVGWHSALFNPRTGISCPMRWTSTLLLFVAAPAAAQVNPIIRSRRPRQSRSCRCSIRPPTISPSGQDEPGYRSWYWRIAARTPPASRRSTTISRTRASAGILPTWQIAAHRDVLAALRRRSRSKSRRSANGRTSSQTLRYVSDYVIPAVGPVEAGLGLSQPGAQRLRRRSAGKRAQALFGDRHGAASADQPRGTDADSCARSTRAAGTDYAVGLGFYAFLRFHVDTTKYRRWGADPNLASCPPIIRPVDVATVGQPVTPVAVATDPLAPIVQSAPATVGPRSCSRLPRPSPLRRRRRNHSNTDSTLVLV